MHIERLVGTGVIELLDPVIDDDLGLLRGCEPFGIENLSTQRPVESRTG